MRKQDFNFDLPKELIANFPLPQRSASRLLYLNGKDGGLSHNGFADVLNYLNKGDLLVFNDTRVIPARMFGRKQTGGKVEVLAERVTGERQFIAQVRASKALQPEAVIELFDAAGALSQHSLKVLGRDGAFYQLETVNANCGDVMAVTGHMPLPPYIERSDEQSDFERYQTVYSARPGAVAAPTAGLHFDDEMLQAVADKGAASAFVTLHVGAGTFQPLRVDDVNDHVMHKEWLEVSAETCEKIRQTVANGGRVIAVGTTAVRSLETAAGNGELTPYTGETQLFITPGYKFQVVDAMITNFHLPESTLIMLVSAFAGKDNVMRAYQAAVTEQYRFFSYGDAMFVDGKAASAMRQNYVG